MFHECHMICFDVQNVYLCVLCIKLWCTKCIFVCTMYYALVCKMYVVCIMRYAMVWKMYVLWNMLWCAKCMFVCTMKYALVCTMFVCMHYEICFGVLSWTCQHTCPDIVTCLNCSNCNWKWASVLTLYNKIARKCYACTSSVACLPSLPATFQPTQALQVYWQLTIYTMVLLTERISPSILFKVLLGIACYRSSNSSNYNQYPSSSLPCQYCQRELLYQLLFLKVRTFFMEHTFHNHMSPIVQRGDTVWHSSNCQ